MGTGSGLFSLRKYKILKAICLIHGDSRNLEITAAATGRKHLQMSQPKGALQYAWADLGVLHSIEWQRNGLKKKQTFLIAQVLFS